MKPSAPVYKRARPLLGTILQIDLTDSNAISPQQDHAILQGFQVAEQLESIFSKFSADSELSEFNRQPSHIPKHTSLDFYTLCDLAEFLWRESAGAFNPFFPAQIPLTEKPLRLLPHYQIEKNNPHPIDLSGIAKGYIVDAVVKKISALLPHSSGTVNAGGDLHFWGRHPEQIMLRLGDYASPLIRSCKTQKPAAASSAPSYAQNNAHSNTRYGKLRVPQNYSVSALADSCTIADALTKIALYADEQTIATCANNFSAQVLVFDELGEIQEAYGEI